MRCYIITGSLTLEGDVAYLREDGSWTGTLGESRLFGTREEADGRLAEVAAMEATITEPYVFEAEKTDAGIRPLSAREALRSNGPSTRLRRPDGAATPLS